MLLLLGSLDVSRLLTKKSVISFTFLVLGSPIVVQAIEAKTNRNLKIFRYLILLNTADQLTNKTSYNNNVAS